MDRLEQIRAFLLANFAKEFDDNHTRDACLIAKVAELAGLSVVYAPCDGCDGELFPIRIE